MDLGDDVKLAVSRSLEVISRRTGGWRSTSPDDGGIQAADGFKTESV